MEVTAKVALETASHEGLVRQAYRDSKGVLTWSIGVTSKSGHKVDRYIGKPQSMEHCLAIYAWLLETCYAPAVREAFAGTLLTEAQFAAALSFHWNTGAIKSATWPKLWRSGDIPGAMKAFMAWNKPAEIVERRRKECDLFFAGKWSNDGRITEYTRVTAGMTPDWSSAKRIDVRDAIAAALAVAKPGAVMPANPPVPAAPVTDLSPPPAAPAAEAGWLARFWAGLKSAFGV